MDADQFKAEFEKGNACLVNGQLTEAEEIFIALRQVAPRSAAVLCKLGETHREMARYASAMACFNKAARLNPAMAWPAIGRAEVLAAQGLVESALDELRRVKAHHPDLRHVERRIDGLVRLLQPESAPALAKTESERCQPGFAELATLGRQARSEGRREDALMYFMSARELEPDHATLPADIAGELRALGRSEEAILLLEGALGRGSQGTFQLHQQLAIILGATGRHAEAQKHFERALSFRPDDRQARSWVAAGLIELGQLEDAAVILEGLARQHQGWDRPHRLLVRIFRVTGQRDQLIGHLSRIHSLNPDNLADALALAGELRESGELVRASQLLDEYETLGEGSAAFCFHRGVIAQFRDDAGQAFAWFEKGITLDPDDARCYQGKVHELLKQGLLDDAMSLLEVAFSLIGRTPALERLELLLLRGKGFLREAIEAAEVILKIRPGDFLIRNLLIELQIFLGRFDEAEQNLNGFDNPDTYDRQRILFLRAGLARARYQIDEAVGYYSSAMVLSPDDGMSHRFLASLLLMKGDARYAGKFLKSADRLLGQHASQRYRVLIRSSLWHDIWLEMRTNPIAELRLAESLNRPLSQQPAAITEILREEPAHFGSALTLLVVLRRIGVFDRPETVPKDFTGHIPRQIIQFWDSEEIPDDILDNTNSWIAHHQGFEHTIFSDGSAEAFIEDHLGEDVLRAFRMAGHPAMRADLFRLAWLLVCGGFYADVDDLCRTPLDGWLIQDSPLILLQEDIGSIGNNFMAAAPGQAFIERSLDQVTHNILRRQGNSVWFISGPGTLTQIFCNHFLGVLEKKMIPDDVRLINRYLAEEHISMHLPRAYKQSERHWSFPGQEVGGLFRHPVVFRRNLRN